MDYKNKKILITGGTGLIGTALTEILIKEGAKITIASLDNVKKKLKNVEYKKIDLRSFDNCKIIAKNKDGIFHLAGIKGSPQMMKKRPSDFFVPLIQFNTNMIEASRLANVKFFLYASSIGVYSPAKIFKENSVWRTFPSPNDIYGGWAKRMGELQIQSYIDQYKLKNFYIVRPANVFGPRDNFYVVSAMVIPTLINKFSTATKYEKISLHGDGSQIRDFIFSYDCANGMLFVVKNKITKPVNLGSGKGVSIKRIVNILNNIYKEKKIKIHWKKNFSGDKKRLMDMSYMHKLGFKSNYTMEQAIKITANWFEKNNKIYKDRFKYL